MIESGWSTVALALGAGGLLGAMYVFALWHTVAWATRRGRRGESYALGLFASLAARVTAAAAGIALAWFVTPAAGVATLVGFLGVRSAVTLVVSNHLEVTWS